MKEYKVFFRIDDEEAILKKTVGEQDDLNGELNEETIPAELPEQAKSLFLEFLKDGAEVTEETENRITISDGETTTRYVVVRVEEKKQIM